MNTEKEAILIVNEVLGYVHSKFIREGSAFSQEYINFRQNHNDRITDIVKQRLETGQIDAVVSVLEERKKHWHDKAKGSLVDNYYDELEDANHMYAVYIDVISDIKEAH